MHRRQALLGIVTVVGLVPGCSDSNEPQTSDSPVTTDLSETSHSTPSPRSESPNPEPTPESKGPVRGEHEADISIRVTDSRDLVEYIPQNDTVRRHLVSMSKYSYTDWEVWAERQCAEAAEDPAVEHVRSEFEQRVTLRSGSDDETAYVAITTNVVRDGTVRSRPNIDFDQLVAATPKAVNVTYALEGREYTCEVPVYARHIILRTE